MDEKSHMDKVEVSLLWACLFTPLGAGQRIYSKHHKRKDKMKNAIYMMGLPAAGKSTYVEANLDLENFTRIDADLVKETHPDYDPANPAPLHNWSKRESARILDNAFANGENVIVDGTGTSAEKMVARIKRAAKLGYTTKLIFVKVKLETSLKRNAARDRVVPTEVILEKAETVLTSFEIVSKYADSVEVVDND